MTDSIAVTRNDWDDLSESGDGRDLRGRPNWTDALFFVVLAVGAGYALSTFNSAMDYYEQTILVRLALASLAYLAGRDGSGRGLCDLVISRRDWTR